MMDILSEFHFSNEFWMLLLPFCMIGLDFLTGLVYAWASKTFKSSKMRTGLSKKVGEIAILVIGELFSYALGLPDYLMVFISMYICLMELMSIFENLDKMGVKIPKFVRDVVNNTDKALSEDDLTKLNEDAENLHSEIDSIKKK